MTVLENIYTSTLEFFWIGGVIFRFLYASMTSSQLIKSIASGKFTFMQLLLSTLDILLYIPASTTINLLFLRLSLSFDISMAKSNMWLLLDIL